MRLAISLSLVLAFVLAGCRDTEEVTPSEFAEASTAAFRYVGRVDHSDPTAPVLAGAAAYTEFGFRGDTAWVSLKATDFEPGHTWAALEVDGKYLGKFQVPSGGTLSLALPAASALDTLHRARVHHAAEALFGRLVFLGAKAERIERWRDEPEQKIVYFGDSITSGAASDTTHFACGEGAHHDNTNAYLAYTGEAARALDADLIVHSVSGRGLYINWNGQDPPLLDLLPHLYLDTADATPYDMASVDPDLVVIALGTNDINSAPELRPEFDSTYFEQRYGAFVDTLRELYPESAILLSGSPMKNEAMNSGRKGALLNRIIGRVATSARRRHPNLRIDTHEVPGRQLSGCPAGPHPSVAEHAAIAEEMLPVMRALLKPS